MVSEVDLSAIGVFRVGVSRNELSRFRNGTIVRSFS